MLFVDFLCFVVGEEISPSMDHDTNERAENLRQGRSLATSSLASRLLNRIEGIKEAFSLFDWEGEGEVGFDAFQQALKVLGQEVSEDRAWEIFNEIDEDGSGLMDFEEFMSMLTKGRMNSKMDFIAELKNLRELFANADVTNSGSLGARDLQKHFEIVNVSRGLKVVQTMISEVDRDGDGRIDFAEFVQISTSLPTNSRKRKDEHLGDINSQLEKAAKLVMKVLGDTQATAPFTNPEELREIMERGERSGIRREKRHEHISAEQVEEVLMHLRNGENENGGMEVPVFSKGGMREDVARELVKGMRLVRVSPDGVICRQGGTALYFYILLEGSVDVYLKPEGGMSKRVGGLWGVVQMGIQQLVQVLSAAQSDFPSPNELCRLGQTDEKDASTHRLVIRVWGELGQSSVEIGKLLQQIDEVLKSINLLQLKGEAILGSDLGEVQSQEELEFQGGFVVDGLHAVLQTSLVLTRLYTEFRSEVIESMDELAETECKKDSSELAELETCHQLIDSVAEVAGFLKAVLPGLMALLMEQFTHKTSKAAERESAFSIEKESDEEPEEETIAGDPTTSLSGDEIKQQQQQQHDSLVTDGGASSRDQVQVKIALVEGKVGLGTFVAGQSFGNAIFKRGADEADEAPVSGATCRGSKADPNAGIKGAGGGAILGVIPRREYLMALAVEPARDLRQLPCFDGLDDAQINRLAMQVRKQSHSYRGKVFQQGSPTDGLLILKSGEIRLEVESCLQEGDRVVHSLASVGAGNVIEEAKMDIAGQWHHTATGVVSSHRAEVYRISRQFFLKVTGKFGCRLLQERSVHRSEVTIGQREQKRRMLEGMLDPMIVRLKEAKAADQDSETATQGGGPRRRRPDAADDDLRPFDLQEALSSLPAVPGDHSKFGKAQGKSSGRRLQLDKIHGGKKPTRPSPQQEERGDTPPPSLEEEEEEEEEGGAGSSIIKGLSKEGRYRRRQKAFEIALVDHGYLPKPPKGREGWVRPRRDAAHQEELREQARHHAAAIEAHRGRSLDQQSKNRAFHKILSACPECSDNHARHVQVARKMDMLQMRIGRDIDDHRASLKELSYRRVDLHNEGRGRRANIAEVAQWAPRTRANVMKARAAEAEVRMAQASVRRSNMHVAQMNRHEELMAVQLRRAMVHASKTRTMPGSGTFASGATVPKLRRPPRASGSRTARNLRRSSEPPLVPGFFVTSGVTTVEEVPVRVGPLTARF